MIDVEAIRARCEAATPGPWRIGFENGSIDPDIIQTFGEELRIDANDALFIVRARQDIPALLADREELLKEIRAAKDAHRKTLEDVERLNAILAACDMPWSTAEKVVSSLIKKNEELQADAQRWKVEWQGTYDAARMQKKSLEAENAALRKERDQLRAVHEAELGVCKNHCDYALELKSENAALRREQAKAIEFLTAAESHLVAEPDKTFLEIGYAIRELGWGIVRSPQGAGEREEKT